MVPLKGKDIQVSLDKEKNQCGWRTWSQRSSSILYTPRHSYTVVYLMCISDQPQVKQMYACQYQVWYHANHAVKSLVNFVILHHLVWLHVATNIRVNFWPQCLKNVNWIYEDWKILGRGDHNYDVKSINSQIPKLESKFTLASDPGTNKGSQWSQSIYDLLHAWEKKGCRERSDQKFWGGDQKKKRKKKYLLHPRNKEVSTGLICMLSFLCNVRLCMGGMICCSSLTSE